MHAGVLDGRTPQATATPKRGECLSTANGPLQPIAAKSVPHDATPRMRAATKGTAVARYTEEQPRWDFELKQWVNCAVLVKPFCESDADGIPEPPQASDEHVPQTKPTGEPPVTMDFVAQVLAVWETLSARRTSMKPSTNVKANDAPCDSPPTTPCMMANSTGSGGRPTHLLSHELTLFSLCCRNYPARPLAGRQPHFGK